MHLKVKPGKMPFCAPMLNGDYFFIEYKGYEKNESSIRYLFESFVKNGDQIFRGFIFGLLSSISAPIDTYSNKLNILNLKKALEDNFNLTDIDLEYLADLVWQYEDRSYRLTIPIDVVIKNSFYNQLISSILAAGTPYQKENDCYIIYLQEIYPEHINYLQNDSNVILETL